MSLEDTIQDLAQTARSARSGTNSMGATYRERERLEEITKQAAKRLGLDEDEAKQLYWGGLQKDIIQEEKPDTKVKAPVEDRRIRQEDVEIIEERVMPAVKEVTIELKDPFEALGIIFEGATPKVRSVDPRSPAARAGVLPSSIIVKIDGLDTYSSLPTLISYLKSIRLAKRVFFVLEMYLETPPMAILPGSEPFTSPGLASVTRPDMAKIFRNRERDCATYTPPEYNKKYTIETLQGNSTSSLDARKVFLRYPCPPDDTNVEQRRDKSETPVSKHHALYRIPAWVWSVSLEEESKRGDILRHYKGFLLQLSVVFKMDKVREEVSRALTEISSQEDEYYKERIGWSTALVWENDVADHMRPVAVTHVRPPPVPPSQDWVNPIPRELQSIRSAMSQYTRTGEVIRTPASVPKWGVKSAEVAFIFLCGGLGVQKR